MRFRNFFIGFLLFSFPFLVLAQTSAEEAKEKTRQKTELLEQILGDVPNLKLGENRAFVFAKVGNLLWETDEKRARALFQNAVGELINAQMLAEANRKSAAYQNDLLTGQGTRPQILNIIASRDAELALEYLFKTRPAALAKAFSMQPSPKNSKISDAPANNRYLAENEFNLEQSFIRLAADQSPERAAALLKESLKKGVSNETLNLLKKLHEKDAETAREIASEIVGKLIRNKFADENQPNYRNLNTAAVFLTEFIREKAATEKALKFDDSQMRNLADKLISFYLGQNSGYYNHYQIIPIAEKLSPGSVEQLKKLQKNNPRHGGIYVHFDPEFNKLMSGETTAEQLLAEAKKFPVMSQRQIYQQAANKLAQQGDMNRAVEVLTDNFSDDALEEAIRNLNVQYSYNLMSAGKFAEAERLIDEMPEGQRQSSYIYLANNIYQQNPAENKSHAVAVLEKAHALISEKPENQTEMSQLMRIIGVYSNIEISKAFLLFEPLIPQMNELYNASVVLSGFQGGSNIRQGEFVMGQGSSFAFYGADFSVFGTFVKNDFDRTINLVDGFTRREIRIALKLQLAENILN